MATTEQFSLRWNNFHSNLTAGFHELLESSDMVDVTLAVEGHFFQAHKVVLSICSPYFKQMFKVNPCKHPIVILKDVAHNNMKDILEFMYMGEVNVLKENLGTFLRTAELLQVKGLTGDDSSETSSRKDEKSVEEEVDFGHFALDSDVDLPIYSTPRVSSPPPLPPNKRHKAQNGGAKKKTEKVIKTETENSNDTDFAAEKNVNETEDAKDTLKQILENNFPGGTADATLSDQDEQQKVYVYCPYCCRRFVNRYNLKVHIRDKHEDTPSEQLDCTVCGKVMRNRSCLRVHMYHHRKQQVEQLETKVLV